MLKRTVLPRRKKPTSRRLRCQSLERRLLLAGDLCQYEAEVEASLASLDSVVAAYDTPLQQQSGPSHEDIRDNETASADSIPSKLHSDHPASEPTDASTHEWLIQLSDGAGDVDRYGLDAIYATSGEGNSVYGPSLITSLQAAPYLSNAYFVSMVVPTDESRALSQIGDLADSIDLLYPLVARQHVTRAIPNDPLFADQWHLRNTGQSGGASGVDANIVDVWDQFTGSGVVIAIVDDGVEYSHPDLQANYVAADSYDFNDDDNDPAPDVNSEFPDDHGTAVAGVAAAVADNQNGVSGASPDAGFAALRLIAGPTTDAIDADALAHNFQSIDIYSNSWGPADDGTLTPPGQAGPLALAAIEQGATQGRGGLGSIYVWAGGNGQVAQDNSNYDRFANSRHTIAVGAIDDLGFQSWYSEPGANLLVVAHSSGDVSGITTTDLTGNDGYAFGDYTSDFGGTSSATPLVSGVIALMLEANPLLTARDVQHILVESAAVTDPDDSDWTINGAGHDINHRYGFGAIDAEAAVALAQQFVSVGPETSWESPVANVEGQIPANASSRVTDRIQASNAIDIEHV
ncbi:MAG: S8 family serine peptidase, partial [Planctomycetota bacterium]